MTGNSVAKNLEEIRERIKKVSAGRNVQLLAVSKKQPNEKIQEAFQEKQLHFGENYVQELLSKKADFPSEIRWHMIGPLQRKKAKQVVGEVELIHSVDRIELLEELQKRAEEKNVNQRILLQINIGKEETKSGFLPENFQEALDQDYPNINIEGLMCLPPLTDDEVAKAKYFAETRRLFEMLPNAKTLSMGTTHDFEVAIAEGSNLVRVGTAIFGERS